MTLIAPVPSVAATAYVAHPVAGDVAENIARALRWLKYLSANYPEWALFMPWVAYVLAHGADPVNEDIHRARGMRDNLAFVRQADGIILCGGSITAGMDSEFRHAVAHGKWMLDLTGLGPEPPEDLLGDAA